MPRKPRPLDRESGRVRDASLLIIASEDTYAVKQYFARFKTRRVQVEVLPSEEGYSAPNHVLQRLTAFKKEYVTEEGDAFWLCIDRDRWPDNVFDAVLRDAATIGYEVAVSLPCFELWLLLHYEDVFVADITNCESVRTKLQTVLGGYNKTQCCTKIALNGELVGKAIERARALDDGSFSPTVPLSRVYRILEAIIALDRISFA